MEVLVAFQPNKKEDNFEGARLRKTIKGSLEMAGIPYAKSIFDHFDVVHLISPVDESVELEARERNVPVVVSALYCENDPAASYIEFKKRDGIKTSSLSNKGLRFLNNANLVLVPTEEAKEFLINNGVVTEIRIQKTPINLSRFDFSRDDEKEIFYRYFKESKNKRLVLAVGEYDNMDGMNAFTSAAKKNPDAVFYFIGQTKSLKTVKFKAKQIIRNAPKNVKFSALVPDDIYRSALLNASVLMLPSYKMTGMIALTEAMAAKCQLIVRKQSTFPGLIVNGETGYVAEFSETLASLCKDYLEGKLQPTYDNAYKLVNSSSLKEIGKELESIYKEQMFKNI